jgi:hypothetical protein
MEKWNLGDGLHLQWFLIASRPPTSLMMGELWEKLAFFFARTKHAWESENLHTQKGILMGWRPGSSGQVPVKQVQDFDGTVTRTIAAVSSLLSCKMSSVAPVSQTM